MSANEMPRSVSAEREDRGSIILRDTVPFLILAWLIVAARLLSRRLVKAFIGGDDYMIVAALILASGTALGSYTQPAFGAGKHIQMVSKAEQRAYFKVAYCTSLIYASAITTAKLSILLFYQRLFTTSTMRNLTRFTGLVCLSWWIAVATVQIFSCHPIHGFWDTSSQSRCIDRNRFYIGVAIPNILTDLVMLALPVRMVWRLHTTTAQKIGLMITFMTGGLVIIVSLIRLVLLTRRTHVDPTWNDVELILWTTIEPLFAVVCACLPTLRPLVPYLGPKLKSLLHPWRHCSKQRHGYSVELEPRINARHRRESVHSMEWAREPVSDPPASTLKRNATGATVTATCDPERDERLLPGIHVEHSFLVERAIV